MSANSNYNGQYPYIQRHVYPMVVVNAPQNDPQSAPRSLPSSRHLAPQAFHQYSAVEQNLQGAPDMDVKPVITPQLPPDYRIVLLSLADQYISVARKMVPSIVYASDGTNIARYHELISAGLRCVESSLRHPNFQGRSPRHDALLQLKYASLLFEETEEYTTIEELLSKSIMSCERNRFLDLKYSMHHLLVRVLSKTKLRAALKHVDFVLSECETLQFIPWIYAFQFLRSSLLLHLTTQRDMSTAITGLKRVAELARQRNDAEIAIAATSMQCAVHLRCCREDSSTEAQRALASARAQLSNYATKDLPHMHVLIHQLDLAISLMPYDYKQVQLKLHAMQQLMDNQLSHVRWRRDRGYVLRMNLAGMESLIVETGGVFHDDEDQGVGLSFSWLGRVEAYGLAFLLSAISSFQKNARDKKCEAYLREALKSTSDGHIIKDTPQTLPLALACDKAESLRHMRCVTYSQLAFAHCFRTNWSSAQGALQQTVRYMSDSATSSASPSNLLTIMTEYLQGVIYQGQGELEKALSTFQKIDLSFNKVDAATLSSGGIFSILAALNTLLIIHPPSHPQHHLVPGLVERLHTYFPTIHSNGSSPTTVAAQHPELSSAYHLVVAILQQNQDSRSISDFRATADVKNKNILALKQVLQASINGAQRANNPLLKTLCLCYMHHAFFGGIVDHQAERIAQGSAVQAGESGNQMWIDIATDKYNRVRGQQRP